MTPERTDTSDPAAQPSASPATPAATLRCHVLIAAGGSGSRAGGDRPKQYQQVGGEPVLMHTLRAFAAVPGLPGLSVRVLVSRGDPHVRRLPLAEFGPAVRVLEAAGDTRAHTVRNGLQALLDEGAALSDWVLVHDAARCLIRPQAIAELIAACRDDPVGGLLALPLGDTLKQGDGQRVRATVSRADKWLAQTPQMFRLGVLRDALHAAGDAVTDESSAVEALGLQPLLVTGSADNFKLTWPDDFALAAAVLAARAAMNPPAPSTEIRT